MKEVLGMFNSKKRAEAKRFYLDRIHETCKTTSVEEILKEENRSLRADRDVVYQLYEEVRDKSTAQAEEIEVLKAELEAAHADKRAMADELDSVYKGMETIRSTCNEYLGRAFNDASCKELDSTDFTIDDAINFASSLEDGSCDDDDDDYDDFWDYDDPEEAIHDELFERNDDEEEEDDEDECCECPREKAINNVIGCIVDLLTGTPADKVVEELDTDTIFGVLFG